MLARNRTAIRNPCHGEAPSSYAAPVSARPRAVPVARVMLSTPPAMPDWRLGAAAMIAALFGGVNNPSPAPTTASPVIRVSCPGRPKARAISMMAAIVMPATVSSRGPRRSARRPASGATTARHNGMTVSSSPARPGDARSARSR